jgi:hypothetical protein
VTTRTRPDRTQLANHLSTQLPTQLSNLIEGVSLNGW